MNWKGGQGNRGEALTNSQLGGNPGRNKKTSGGGGGKKNAIHTFTQTNGKENKISSTKTHRGTTQKFHLVIALIVGVCWGIKKIP